MTSINHRRWPGLVIILSVVGIASMLVFSPAVTAAATDQQERQYQEAIEADKNSRFEEAYRLLVPLAEGGYAPAQVNLGVMYVKGRGVARDDTQAVAWFRKAAEQGDAAAQHNLGVMYEAGRGVARDDAQAVAWYRKAAEQGVASAQNKLGVMYADGRGVARDESQAVAWYRNAAEQGYAYAQFNLGVMYASGRGVARNESQAEAWYRMAAEQGYAPAQILLGLMYSEDRRVARDGAQAVAWFRKAAEQGDALGQAGLGLMYADGRGIEKNYAWAVYWYAKAAQQGDDFAIRSIPGSLERLVKLKAKGTVNIREEPAAESKKTATVPAGASLYRLETLDGWYRIYVESGHALGYVASSLVYEVPDSAFQGSVGKAGASASGDGWPTQPTKRPGVVSCNTTCFNGDCKRTYDDGRKVRIRAKQTFNPMTSQWEFDAGGC